MEKKDWILNNIHLKEGGLEDLLFEYADAVIEDYQGRIEDEETLTSVSVSKKIDEEVYNLVQQELDKAREEEQFTKEELELILDGLETKHDEYSGVIDLTEYDKIADKVSKLKQ
jgi:hypothetical protein